jgi:ferredoxin-NADP reductase
VNAPTEKFPLVIQSVMRETADIVSLVLQAPDGGLLRHFIPGAHIDLWLPGGVVRQYALCCAPDEPNSYRIAVRIIADGRASHFFKSDASVGQTIEATGPRDTFGFTPAPAYLFVAGDIGVASILPMLHAATSAGATWHLHYFINDLAQPPLHRELINFGNHISLHRMVDSGTPALVEGLKHFDPQTRLYCCGPSALMLEVERLAATWPDGDVRFEWYAQRQTAADMRRKPIRIECSRSKRTIDVPSDKTILDALLEAGLDLPRSCREGNCGTCAVRVLDGVPEHCDSILSEEQRARGQIMMICVSRAQSDRLVLDL